MTTASSTLLGRPVWYELMTSDTGAAETFYKNVVGWTASPFEGSPMPYTQFKRSGDVGVAGLMKTPEGMPFPPFWAMYIAVPDFDDAVAQIKRRGGGEFSPVIDIPGVGRMQMMKDPQGAAFYILQPASTEDRPETAPELGEGSWHELMTTDAPAAMTFYSEVFGWQPSESMDMGEMGTYQMFNRPHGMIGGMMNKPPEMANVKFTRFRVRPGEDASCLNLYRPTNPTVVAPEAGFIESGRFSFTASLAENDQERANPWLLLRRQFADRVIPVIADATSLQYVLHAAVGDDFRLDSGGAQPITLRFVAALRDSVLQGELVMGEEHFVRLFPGQQGYRFFLIDAPDVRNADDATTLAGVVERELSPAGVDAVTAAERLAAFHRVENTYLSTFQALGGLGLLLGTLGLATVMFRNVLERRRELALLRAVGYDSRRVSLLIVAEVALLLGAGLAAGAGCAALAIAPAWIGHAGSLPGVGLAALLATVIAAGFLSAFAAARAAVRGRMLEALRAD